MSAASIIWGVGERMKRLIDEPSDSQRLLLSEMESTITLVNAADLVTKKSKQFVQLEKLLLQLSYDIADAVELRILSKRKARFSKLFRLSSFSSSSNGHPDLETLTSELINMKKILEYIIENSPYSKGRHRPKGRGDENAVAVAVGVGMGMERKVKEGDVSRSRGPGDENAVAVAVEVELKVKEGLTRAESVVCIYGDSGMGKTTLARKVLDDARAGEYFLRFAWVRVDQECEPRKVFEGILQDLDPAKKKADIRGMDWQEMIQQILIIQMDRSCLIVLDDVRGVADWDNIRSALLVGSSSTTLITTSSSQLAEMVKSRGRLCQMQPLNGAEIFTLLKEKASFNDRELEVYGEIISSLSQGSPLFALVLGKSFKTADEMARGEVVDELDTYRNRISQGENQVFDICYDILGNEVKPCWIYMGQFPEGQDIEVEKLHLLFEAEGIMPPEEWGTSRNNQIRVQSMREILQKLAQRQLVKLQEDIIASTTPMYKSCQLHQLIRNFCISKGREKELFEIVEVESGTQAIKIAPSTRRLAIYLSHYKDRSAITLTTQNTAKKIRSILIFDTLGSQRETPKIKGLNQFSGLRVLDFHGVYFRVRKKVLKGSGIHKLVLLRYLSFRECWLVAFPSSMSKFLMLETLDLRVHSDCIMVIPNILSNMKTLRNLYLPLQYETQDKTTKLRLCGLERLEILVHFQTGECDVNDLSQLTALQILTTISRGNHGDLAAIVEGPASNLQQTSFIVRNFHGYSADGAAVLRGLLECESLQSLDIQGLINRFPKDINISPNLSEIIFDGSEIEDHPAIVLQSLNNLRSIVLSNNAFVGEEMSIVFSLKHFPNLRSLKLLNLRNLKRLEFHRGSVPRLSILVVDKCANLHEFSMHKALDSRLQAERRKKGDHVYSVDLTPKTNNDY